MGEKMRRKKRIYEIYDVNIGEILAICYDHDCAWHLIEFACDDNDEYNYRVYLEQD